MTLLAGTVLTGCTMHEDPPEGQAPDAQPTTLYTHAWSYGPNYQGTNELPVFEDAFGVSEGFENLTVRITWRIEQGHAAVELRPPDGETINLTSEETGGPEGSAVRELPAQAGTSEVEIPTWRGEDGSFPQGHVRLAVEGAANGAS